MKREHEHEHEHETTLTTDMITKHDLWRLTLGLHALTVLHWPDPGVPVGLELGVDDELEVGVEDGVETGVDDGLEIGVEDGLEIGVDDGLLELDDGLVLLD